MLAVEFALDVRLSIVLLLGYWLISIQDAQIFAKETGARLERKVDMVQQGIKVSNITPWNCCCY